MVDGPGVGGCVCCEAGIEMSSVVGLQYETFGVLD